MHKEDKMAFCIGILPPLPFVVLVQRLLQGLKGRVLRKYRSKDESSGGNER